MSIAVKDSPVDQADERVKKILGTQLSDQTVAEVFGVSRQSVNGWRRSQGKRPLYSVEDVQAMIAERQKSLEDIKGRMGDVILDLLT